MNKRTIAIPAIVAGALLTLASGADETTASTTTGVDHVLARVLGGLGLLVGTVGVALTIISRRASRAAA